MRKIGLSMLIGTAAMLAQIGATQAAFEVYDSPNLETRLRSFAAKCQQQHPTAKMFTVYHRGYPFPVAVQCDFDAEGGKPSGMMNEWFRPPQEPCSGLGSSGQTSTSGCASTLIRLEFDPATLDTKPPVNRR